jgi:hypothetical protein
MKHSLSYWLLRFPVGEIIHCVVYFCFIFPTVCMYNFIYVERISIRFCIFASIVIGSINNCYGYFKRLYEEIKEE